MFYYIWAVAGRQIVLCIGKLKLFRNLISRSVMAKIYADVVQDALITSVIEPARRQKREKTSPCTKNLPCLLYLKHVEQKVYNTLICRSNFICFLSFKNQIAFALIFVVM